MTDSQFVYVILPERCYCVCTGVQHSYLIYSWYWVWCELTIYVNVSYCNYGISGFINNVVISCMHVYLTLSLLDSWKTCRDGGIVPCMGGWFTHTSTKSLATMVHTLVQVMMLAFRCLATNYKFVNIIIRPLYNMPKNAQKMNNATVMNLTLS